MNNWCEHIGHHSQVGDKKFNWYCYELSFLVQDSVKFCPICAAPRPEDQSPQEEKTEHAEHIPGRRCPDCTWPLIKKTEGEKMEDKVWCEHIKPSGKHNQATWQYTPINKYDDDLKREAGLDWDFCPICGTPRPSEKEDEYEKEISDGIERATKRRDERKHHDLSVNPKDCCKPEPSLRERVNKIENWIDQWENYDSGWLK